MGSKKKKKKKKNASEEEAGTQLASICKLPVGAVGEGKEGRRRRKQKRVRVDVGQVDEWKATAGSQTRLRRARGARLDACVRKGEAGPYAVTGNLLIGTRISILVVVRIARAKSNCRSQVEA
jgi:hypothetical protein